jgi:hypothetical protein
VFHYGFNGRLPEVAFQVDAGLEDSDALAFEEFSLQGSIWLADEDLAAFTDDAMPGNAFSGRSRGHGASGASRAAGQAQSLSEGSIG